MRIAKRVCKKEEDEKTFIELGRKVLKATSKDEILQIFEILEGKKCTSLVGLPKADQSSWEMDQEWVKWWSNEAILGFFSFYPFC